MPTFCDERGVDKTEIKINKIRLLVLDIDGVLNSRNFFMNRVKKENSQLQDIDPEAVKLLNWIIDETNCRILLSSTWRHDFKTSMGVNIFFEAIGVRPVCIGLTPDYQTERGTEILGWLIKHRYQKYPIIVESLTILDDDNDMGIFMPWWVHCKNETGLTKREAKIAKLMLLGSHFDLTVPLF